MQFETALNTVWLALGVFALASTIRARLHTAKFVRSAPVWLHVCGVAMIVAALFPYISATDDILRIQHMDIQQTHDRQHQSDRRSSNDGLMRLYETMDTPLICAVQQITISTFFTVLVAKLSATIVTRHAPATSGRSPPFQPV